MSKIGFIVPTYDNLEGLKKLTKLKYSKIDIPIIHKGGVTTKMRGSTLKTLKSRAHS